MPTWIFITAEECRDTVLEIRGECYHHLVRVRRTRVGEALRAALPDGRVLVAEVTEISAEMLRAHITGEEPAVGQSTCRITLYQAVLKGEKMDLVVQKATELGVYALAPVWTRRSIPHWTPAQAYERTVRWQRIAEAASAQCERSIPPCIALPCELSAVSPSGADLALLLHERDGDSLHELAARHPGRTSLALFIGPEGGWDAEEIRALRVAGVLPIHLGPRILRAETASLTALALAQYLWGDLR